jgi:anthraniloyl-CoA monooxygenase
MDRSDMEEVRDDFVSAAGMAHEAGFDAIEVHMAHGYLLSTFISPVTNRRGDDYGGPLERRMRFPLEVLDAVRDMWPKEQPLLVAISAVDFVAGGLEVDEAVEVARTLAAHGCDVVEVLAGQTSVNANAPYDPYFLIHYSERIRNEAGVATLATPRITTMDEINTVVAGGRADISILHRRL